MSRPRLPIGTFGEIWFVPTNSGRVQARANIRDWDGITRPVQATGTTQKSAEIALKATLAERSPSAPTNPSFSQATLCPHQTAHSRSS